MYLILQHFFKKNKKKKSNILNFIMIINYVLNIFKMHYFHFSIYNYNYLKKIQKNCINDIYLNY